MKYAIRLAITSLFVFLASCGGSSGPGTNVTTTPPPPPPSPYLPVTGRITVPSGLSADTFTIVSLGRETNVTAQGDYSAEVYPEGVTVILASFDDRPFALARVVMADAAFDPGTVDIDATTTAISLVFISPFVYTADPVEATNRLEMIGNDASIAAFAQAIDDVFNDANPFNDANFLAAWDNVLSSLESQIPAISSTNPTSYGTTRSSPKTATLRLPQRAVGQQCGLFGDNNERAIDLEYTSISVDQTGDQYYLQPQSNLINAVSWLVEVGEVDRSQYRFTHELDEASDDVFHLYPRIGPVDDPIGQTINGARGYFSLVDVGYWMNRLLRSLRFGGAPDGIAIPCDQDGIYIVRSFSSGRSPEYLELEFVQNEVPNGNENDKDARLINHFSTGMDVLSIALPFVSQLEDPALLDCAILEFAQLWADTSLSIELSDSVFGEVVTATDIATSVASTYGGCLVDAGISSLFTSWLGGSWRALLGRVNQYLTGAQIVERYQFLFLRATPLESMLIMVGSPIVDDSEPPTIPATFTATPVSTNQIALQWSESTDNDDVAEYVLYRDNEIIGSTDALFLQDSGLSTSTTYCYEIEAFDFVGIASGRSSPAVCATTLSIPDTTPPTAPENVLTNVVSDTVIDLSWSPSSDDRGVTEYVVFRDDQPLPAVSSTTFSDTGLVAGIQYCYTVVAYDAAGNPSDPSSPPTCATTMVVPDTMAPTVPTGVAATVISDTEIDIVWAEASDETGVAGYRVFRDTVAIDTTVALGYSDNALMPSSPYCYTISAYDAAGNESLPSSIAACVTTLATADTTPPTVPSGLTVAVDSSSQLTVTWQAATDNVGVTGYNIYRDSALHDTVTQPSYTDLGLSGSTEYCYAISALDAAGNESDQSAPICGTTSSASTPTVTKIADSDSVLPNNGSLSCLGVPPMDGDAGRIVFHANGSTGQALYVVENGTIRQIATGDTVAPGALGPFSIFVDSAVDGAQTYFTSGGGAYVEEAGVISLIADATQTTPRGDQTFGAFSLIDADGGVAVFTAGSDPSGVARGIYRYDGAQSTIVADPSTPDPANAGNFDDRLDGGIVGAGLIAITASDFVSGYKGVYVDDGAGLEVVVDTSTVFSNGRDSYFSGPESIDDNGRILFDAFDGDVSHPIYGWQAGTINLVVDVPLVLNGTSLVLNTWKGYSVSDTNRVVTQNFWEDQGDRTIGMYLHENGGITKIIDTNDILDGKETLDLFPEVLDQGTLTFVAWFVDDSCGIYSVNLDGM